MQKFLFPWQDLIGWYRDHGRHTLPWREYTHTKSDLLYRVWISEVLLQQTQVDRVIPYFQRILDRYPHISTISEATYEEFFPYYQGMGYYSRARNILKTAKIIHEEYDDTFPLEKHLLTKLPGV
jgi:A/G-specific adenine glycosylase